MGASNEDEEELERADGTALTVAEGPSSGTGAGIRVQEGAEDTLDEARAGAKLAAMMAGAMEVGARSV